MIPSPRAVSALVLGVALTFGVALGPSARAQPSTSSRRPVARLVGASPSPRPAGASSGGWWMGMAGTGLALAACGWASLAARRFLPNRPDRASSLRVVGRTSLSPKHTVYLLDVGGRVLIVGTGPQGAPSLLGEMLGEECLEPSHRLVAGPSSGRLDIRLGESP